MNTSHEHFYPRESGLVVPFRALPGDHDHQGTLGADAVAFLEFMQKSGFNILHDLPNTPPDEFDCPYSSISAFALDAQRIDLMQLAATGDVSLTDISHYQHLISSGDAGPAIKSEKEALLKRAFVSFDTTGSPERHEEFNTWRENEAFWLDSYAAYEILKKLPENHGKRWQDWKIGKDYTPELIADVKAHSEQEFLAISYTQWVAEGQTMRYLQAAERLGVEVWGDVPFYVGSSEVWAHRDIFNLDADGNQLTQGGAAPSATSSTGQIWGNATYKIDPAHHPLETAKAVDWWSKRLIRAGKLSSGKVRLDHFIGFAEPYIIAAGAEDGLDGWREDGVGRLLFDTLKRNIGDTLPFYPEDLGTMTEKTPQLRDEYGFLSTTLAVRGLTKDLLLGKYRESINNPDNYHSKVVSFTGNHDSPTLIQAIDDVRTKEPAAFDQYIAHLNEQRPEQGMSRKTSSAEFAQVEMERVLRSVGRYAFVGIWDALQLGPEGRYNVPGTVSSDNWSWRMDSAHMQALKSQAESWHALNQNSGRVLRAVS